jgi:hypothetical protein
MKLVSGLYAVSKGGKHDGHEVRVQEKGIYCLTCDKFYPRTPPNNGCSGLGDSVAPEVFQHSEVL